MTAPNFSFEDAGATAGQADSWTLTIPTGAQDIATFEGTILPFEKFESGWQGGNQLSKSEFVVADLRAATFNDSIAEQEDFDSEWKRPVTKTRILLDNHPTPTFPNPNDAFTTGQLYRDRDTGGRALAEEKQGIDTVEFTFVDFVNPAQIQGAGFVTGPPVATHILAALNTGRRALGTADGIKTIFLATLPDTPIHPKPSSLVATFRVEATIAGVLRAFRDDGAGTIVDDGSGSLDSGGTNTVDYATGAVTATFTNGPDSGTEVVASYEFGADATSRSADTAAGEPFIDTVTPLEPSAGHLLPPWHHSGIFTFEPADLDEAQFDGTAQPETFESKWDNNENSQSTFAPADLVSADFDSPVTQAEDFEDQWDVGLGGNEISQSFFIPADLSTAKFDGGPPPVTEDFEDFEEEWTTTLQI